MTQNKQTVVSFRVDHHLAEILNQLPDKSAFIREAILRRFHTTCPFCQGRGVLPEIIAEWLIGKLPAHQAATCSCCHYDYPIDLLPSPPSRSETFICAHCAEHGHDH